MNPAYFCETLEGEEAPLEVEARDKWPYWPTLIGPSNMPKLKKMPNTNNQSKFWGPLQHPDSLTATPLFQKRN